MFYFFCIFVCMHIIVFALLIHRVRISLVEEFTVNVIS